MDRLTKSIEERTIHAGKSCWWFDLVNGSLKEGVVVLENQIFEEAEADEDGKPKRWKEVNKSEYEIKGTDKSTYGIPTDKVFFEKPIN